MSGSEIFQIIGSAAFGAIIGWFVYYINRYRSGDVSFTDVTTLIGAIGGAAVLALFGNNQMLFAGYGIGLFFGFFGYFGALGIMVKRSENFDVDWFLDGRRRLPDGTILVPQNRREVDGRVMTSEGLVPNSDGFHGKHPAASPNVVVNTSGAVTVGDKVAVNEQQSVPEAQVPRRRKSKS